MKRSKHDHLTARVAKRNGVTRAEVEREMQSAIDAAWGKPLPRR